MSSCPGSSVQVYENCGAPAQGLLTYNPSDPFASAYAAAVSQSKPAGAPSSYTLTCEAMLRARGLIYFKTNPGDCGSAQPLPGVLGGGQIVGLSGSAASGIVGGLGVAGVIGGAATLGISAAVSIAVGAIESVFAHHEQAVQNEQATICSVVNYFNPILRQIDAAVQNGQITPAQGITYVSQVANQAISGLAGIMKQCNASCVYQGILQAHIIFVKTYYPGIAPLIPAATAPGAPPSGYGTPPGGVTVSAGNPAPPVPTKSLPVMINSSSPNNQSLTIPSQSTSSTADYLNSGYNQQTGQSEQLAPIPPSEFPSWILPLVAGILILLVVMRAA